VIDRYERVEINGGVWVKRNKNGGMTIGPGAKWNAAREFWGRIIFIGLAIGWIFSDIGRIDCDIIGLVGATRTWTGDGGDNLASTAGNWDGAAPGVGDDALFTGLTGGSPNKSCTWDVSQVSIFSIGNSYSGTVTTNTALTVTGSGSSFGIDGTSGGNVILGAALNTEGIVVYDGGTLKAASFTITAADDVDFSDGTFTYDTSTFIMTGLNTEWSLGASSSGFHNVTINNDVELMAGQAAVIQSGGSLTIGGGKTLSLSSDMFLIDTPVVSISNGGIIAGPGELALRVAGTARILGALGTSNTCPISFETNQPSGSGLITLGSAIGTTGNITVQILNAGTLTLDTGGGNWAIDSGDFTLNASTTLTANGSLITIGGDIDFTTGTFTPGTSELFFTKNVAHTIYKNGGTLDVYDFTLEGDAVTPATLLFAPSGSVWSFRIGFIGSGTLDLQQNTTLTNDMNSSFSIRAGAIPLFTMATGSTLAKGNHSVFLDAAGGGFSFGSNIAGTITVDGVTNDGITVWGTGGSVTLDANLLQSTSNMYVDSTSGALSLVLAGFNLSFNDFALLDANSTLNASAGTPTITASGDVNLSAGTFTQGSSIIDMTGSGGILITGSNSNTLWDLTITDDTSMGGVTTTQNGGTLSVASGKVFTMNANSSFIMRDASVDNFNNQGTITTTLGRSLTFSVINTTVRTLGANIGTLSINVTFRNEAASSGNGVIQLSNDLTTSGTLTVSALDAVDTIELDPNGNNLSSGDLTVGTRGILDVATGTPIINCTGSVDMSVGTFIQGSSIFRMLSTSTETLDVGATSNTFYTYTHASGGSVDVNFTSVATTMTVTNEFDPEGLFTIVDSGSVLKVVPTAGNDRWGTPGSPSTIDGAGLLQWESASGISYDWNQSNFYTLSVDLDFSTAAGSTTVTIANKLDTTGALTNDSGTTIDANTNDLTCGGGTIAGTLQETTGADNQTWTFTANLVVTGTFEIDTGTFTSDQEFELILTGAALDANTSATVTIEGQDPDDMIIITGGNLNFANTTLSLQNIDMDTTDTYAIRLNTATTGTIASCEFTTNNSRALDIISTPGVITIQNSILSGGSNGVLAASTCGNITFIRCTLGGTNSWQQNSQIFSGRMENCLHTGRFQGAALGTGEIALGSVVNCAFTNAVPIVASGSASNKIELIGCIFDESLVSISGSNQVISHLHNRQNNKTMYIGANLSLTSSFQTVIHSDTFDWKTTAGEWDINGDNEFESAKASTNENGLESVFIPVSPSTTYWVKFKGSVGATATQVEIRGYDIGQNHINTHLNRASFSLDDETYSASFATVAATAFIRFEIEASQAGETFYEIEVRETDSNGDLIWTEYLLNHYDWMFVSVDYANYTLQFSGGDKRVPFGDAEYTKPDMTINLISGVSGSDYVGFMCGWQDANNHYEIKLTDTGNKLQFNKIEGGSSTAIDYATNYNGGTPIASITSMRVLWNEEDDATEQLGSITVYLNGLLVKAADWANSSNDYSDADTTFTTGRIGYIGSSSAIDNVEVAHRGLYLWDTDLVLGSGVTITQTAANQAKFTRGVCNSTRAAFDEGGFEYTEEDWEWLDSSFDEYIDGIVNILCPKPNIEINSDITFGPSGQIYFRGAILESADPTEFWTIRTEGSTVEPPMIVHDSIFKHLNIRFRPHDAENGGAVEIDQSDLVNPQFLIDGPGFDKPVNVIIHDAYGRQFSRNTIKSHRSAAVTLKFRSVDNMCLYGRLQEWMRNEALLEVIWPRGYLWKCKIVDLAQTAISPAMNDITFQVRLMEFR
jgi:hypothetical protein